MSFRPFAALSTAAVLSLAGCSQAEGPLQRNPDFQQVTVAVSVGDTVFVRTGRGDIRVEPSVDDTLRIAGSLSWRGREQQPKDVGSKAERVPGGYLVCALFGQAECTSDRYTIGSRKSLRFGGADDSSVDYVVQLPAGVRLGLVAVDGNIVAAASAPVEARSVNGDVTIVTSVGPVRAETVNGSVDARMTTLSGTDSVVVKSINGNAFVFLPESVDATLDLSTVKGQVRGEVPSAESRTGSRKSLRTTLGAGTTPVRVRTLNGDVGFGRLDALGRSSTP